MRRGVHRSQVPLRRERFAPSAAASFHGGFSQEMKSQRELDLLGLSKVRNPSGIARRLAAPGVLCEGLTRSGRGRGLSPTAMGSGMGLSPTADGAAWAARRCHEPESPPLALPLLHPAQLGCLRLSPELAASPAGLGKRGDGAVPKLSGNPHLGEMGKLRHGVMLLALWCLGLAQLMPLATACGGLSVTSRSDPEGDPKAVRGP